MVAGDTYGIDRERLVSRLKFLQTRADVNYASGTRQKSTEKISCAAVMLRDASATAILLGDFSAATTLLLRAGDIWTELGLFAGYFYLRLASPTPWWVSREENLLQIEQAMSAPAEISRKNPLEADLYPHYLRGSAVSPYQLLLLYQSLQTDPLDKRVQNLRRTIRERFADLPETSLLRNRSFRRFFDLVDAHPDELSERHRDHLLRLALERKEQLELAQADTYHWNRAMDPAQIVDFDLVALSMRALEVGNAVVYRDFFGNEDTLSGLPLTSAQGLLSNGRRDTRPR